ncbi:MAG TPA: CPBP family intramembrane glutamic endopeptidase [Polyangiaceae bacterium]|nr:CPBP family intramembrane glutamic endopeptidase [Polyangiaceae bacterium]
MAPGDFPPLDYPDARLAPVSIWMALAKWAPVQALTPIPVILLVAPFVWLLFRKTWRELDEERLAYLNAHPGTDHRPAVCLVLVAIVLTLQEYYGGRGFYQSTWEPWLRELQLGGVRFLNVEKYGDLYGFYWWVAARVLGYVVAPVLVWRVLFPADRVLDMGLRVRGFLSHLWIYGLCLAGVLVAMFFVARQGDFVNYYPFYKNASRSWLDLLTWEAIYFLQFFALEFFFRGWMLSALRPSLGSAAIFAMAAPYCMIHYGKPYLEAHGAIIAGVVLGSLSIRTRSIYAGFLVHITVAGLMDTIALVSRGAMPTRFWP